jgi:GT2 family glycosyltransferase/tetratricopeptide (TPR) repeat protein
MTSLIVLSFNNLDYTRKCIQSIVINTEQRETPYELIVVDNGSTDGTKEYLLNLEKENVLRGVYLESNLGFPGGMNAGVKESKGDYVCLLNNDVVVTKGWLSNLLRCIRSDSKIAAVGPYANHSSGHQQSPIPCTYKNMDEMKTFALTYSAEEKYVDFLVFFCVLIRKSVWDEIGGLDTGFGLGNYDDNLFCYQAIEKGYRLKVVGNCFVHHYVGRTFKKDKKSEIEYAKIMARNQKIFHKKIGKYKTIALCMIFADNGNMPELIRALDSVYEWVDKICLYVNHTHISRAWRFKNILKAIMDKYGDACEIQCEYGVFKDFSYSRNQSFRLAKGSDYIFHMDSDDILLTPAALRDLILKNPDIGAFRCQLKSDTGIGTQETIFHTNLLKNHDWLEWHGKVHEDIGQCLTENKASKVTTNIQVRHLGYLDVKRWKQKNARNYKLLLEEMNTNPQALTYFHMVNCLLILQGKENMEKCVKYVDECFEKLKFEKDDPIVPKLWTLRAIACWDAGQMLAAKQSFHKAYDEHNGYPEAAVNLAEIYIQEKNIEKAIEILKRLYATKEFIVTHIPVDYIQVECMMLEKLGNCYLEKAQKETRPEYYIEAERYYREFLSIKPAIQVLDKLALILRIVGRHGEAAEITLQAVNRYKNYNQGWFALGVFEHMNKRYASAAVFWRECLRINPKHNEARHNLEQIGRMR